MIMDGIYYTKAQNLYVIQLNFEVYMFLRASLLRSIQIHTNFKQNNRAKAVSNFRAFNTQCTLLVNGVGKKMAATENGIAPKVAKELTGKQDKYGGIIIEPNSLPQDAIIFSEQLRNSLQQWRSDNQRGIWLKIPIELSALVPEAVKQGFEYHHAKKEYVMMTLWLPDSEPNRLPASSTHQVGIGAFVLNELHEVLVVQERSGPLKGTGIWKIPTGVANRHEDIYQAAIREVQEETGINAEFQGVVSIRQAHGIAMGNSDLFFVCAMKAQRQELIPEEQEIVAAKWMPLNEYRQMDFLKDQPLHAKILEQCVAYAEGRFMGFMGGRLGGGGAFRPREDFLLWGIDDHANL
eukprot:TRINITY_DN88043_c0_g1_i7.p1 TRINITY_DN88043_c0_g1~~TRINITY_DN88043_c0_g1_i7.p1  ORF type:complete len:350 (+),score=39.62 TRINITY_DN88043_c0_g1_i7:4-1053(+)